MADDVEQKKDPPTILVDGRYWDDMVREVMLVHTVRDVVFGVCLGMLVTVIVFSISARVHAG